MRKIFILVIVVLRLESALNEVIGIVNYQGKKFSYKRCNKISPSHIISTAKRVTSVLFQYFVQCKINKSTYY